MSRVFVGDDLGPETQYTAGPGTVLHKGRIAATLIGTVHTDATRQPPLISVSRPAKHRVGQENTVTAETLLPQVGDIVLCRITRISRLQATAQIIVIGTTALQDDFTGIIRVADIHLHDKDKTQVAASFRPGDICRAQVISLGDAGAYYLATTQNELGVVFAWDEFGEMMYPVSWREMRSDRGSVEERKVAKPFLQA
ncbi:putative exosome 3 [Protomyces lactucae-debilis]|uniref:Putative exosome 3 n=1 Tax=Protomyces lactucae-debilis TaxID=2754530 RepID=A0A1Y2EWV9_PROLT|nr:putative exosome 3 [Protomyces lactucae-debilis]ORY76101.1 putative exosome 3 [Protomyces lactucae-debilis]